MQLRSQSSTVVLKVSGQHVGDLPLVEPPLRRGQHGRRRRNFALRCLVLVDSVDYPPSGRVVVRGYGDARLAAADAIAIPVAAARRYLPRGVGTAG